MAATNAEENTVDLCVLCDATLSMDAYLVQVKEDIQMIINESRSKFGIDDYQFRVAFVAYRDWLGDGKRLETLPFTPNIALFEQFVANLKAEGGDDAAEDVLGGLQMALNLEWSGNIKILYHICDSPPHGTMYHDLYDLQPDTDQEDDAKQSEIEIETRKQSDNESESESESDYDVESYNNAFIKSKLNLGNSCIITDEEKVSLDRFPNKHEQDPDHKELLRVIQSKNIQYYIGEKTAHIDKFCNVMIADAQEMKLKIHRIELPSIQQLFPSLLQSIQSAIKLSSKHESQNDHKLSSNRPLQLNRSGHFKVHVGCDFGTDGSAVSIALTNGKVDIFQWGSNKEYTKTKTNILLSADGQILSFGTEAAGKYSNIMSNMKKDDEEDDYDTDDEENRQNQSSRPMFFEHFKMSLYGEARSDGKDADDDDSKQHKKEIAQTISCIDGRKYSSMKVLCAALTFIKEHVMQILRKKPYYITDIAEVQWILSVPAIWSPKSKYIMIKCAENAGMIYKTTNQKIDNHLLIALEPDCASISIRHSFDDLSQTYNQRNQKKKMKIFQKGDRYLLLDLGGGTADIACSEVLDEYHVKQIRSPSGGPWGSSYIDKEFEKLLRLLFRPKWMDSFERKHPDKYVELLNSFRFRKEKFCFVGGHEFASQDDDNLDANYLELFTMDAMAFIQYASQNKPEEDRIYHNIKLPWEFAEEMEKYVQRVNELKKKQKQKKKNKDDDDDEDDETSEDDEDEILANYFKSFKLFKEYKHLIKVEEEYLCIEESVFRYLFDKVVNEIVDHCRGILAENVMSESKYICLVGGFSESKYVQTKFLYEFGPKSRYKKKIIIPKRPILCVVDGAARYGLRPDSITSRTMTKTYGISIQRELQKFKASHPNVALKANQILKLHDDAFVTNCFLPFVRKNDVIRSDDPPKVFYFETMDKQSAKIQIKLYESNEVNPLFSNSDGCRLCAKCEYDLPSEWRQQNESVIPVSFFFGESTIRVFVFFHQDNQTEITLNYT